MPRHTQPPRRKPRRRYTAPKTAAGPLIANRAQVEALPPLFTLYRRSADGTPVYRRETDCPT